MPTPAISVVIVNWNRKELLHACLDSLAVQAFSDFEVIVVDNGSDDGSVALVQEIMRAFPHPIRIIENHENKGFCAANNQGFAVSQAEYIALLNNDAEADPGWLQAMFDAIRVKPDVGESDVGMVASKILVWENPSIIDKCGHLIYPDGQNRGRGHGQLDQGQFDRQTEALWPDGCAALYRRAMLDEVGGFDEEFFAYADDAELGLRARMAGWNCLYAPGAVVRHHRGATLGLDSAKRLMLIERNRVLLVVKLFPWNLLWVNGAYHLVRIGAGLAAALRGKGDMRRYPGSKGKLTAAMALIKGTLSALPMIPSMLRKRRAFRSKHRLSPKQVRRLLLRFRIPLRELSEHST
ncbi:MAG: glycosyltransferase family 2 protein [Bryobacteraceae bacterium]